MRGFYQIGIARGDITPPIGVTLWGYNPRPSTFVDHPLRAEALACSDEKAGWVLVSADIGGFSRLLTDLVRDDIAARTGLPANAVMVAATHTHSGPHVTDALWREQSELESAYFRDLRIRLADTAVQAWQARAEGEFLHASTAVPELGSNRRLQLADGTWTNQWRDPEGTNPGYFDAGVELVGVRRPDGRLDALLVSYGCHPVVFGGEFTGISGDYPSYLKDALERSGRVGTAIFIPAGHANIDPRQCCQKDPAVTRDMGERLAGIVLAALPRLEPIPAGPVAAVRADWTFMTMWSLNGRMAIYFPFVAKGSKVRTALAGLRAGQLALIGAPGEVVSEYRARLRARSALSHPLLLSVVNDFIGYIPTDTILGEGAYEAAMSPLRPMENAFLERMDAVLAGLNAEKPDMVF